MLKGDTGEKGDKGPVGQGIDGPDGDQGLQGKAVRMIQLRGTALRVVAVYYYLSVPVIITVGLCSCGYGRYGQFEQ